MPCPFMHIRPITCFISRFSLVLILNNKFLYTVFRHAHSPRWRYLGGPFNKPLPHFYLHIPSFGGAWGGRSFLVLAPLFCQFISLLLFNLRPFG